ncbi:hypothetical protein A7E78_06830 [Syntrophotalea acetylenivorans]|uniref:Uncharacterized protein n=1 Tax=Syntrophotalea acetylenivorans TaxID=1842532 RepID=A0A1L3GNW6_9BACT|nr:hypothetical protein [Syntrophotalea acetylenivorans]APG27575.1 hypothetical protein A7E78_06830 [Syntrophotalea acetylenivorans]
MYYLSMKVTPPWNQDRPRKVKQALAHFWVEAETSNSAAHKALDYLEQRQWQVLAIQEKPNEVSEQDDSHGCMGLTQSVRAKVYGLSLCLTDWVYEGLQ